MMPLTLLLTSLLSTAPLEVIVFDSSLQMVVGYGMQQGGQLTIELLEDYSGPVVSMFIRDKVQQKQGVLVGGQLTLSTNNGTSTLQQFIESLGVSAKLSVVKTAKIHTPGASSDNKPGKPDQNSPANKPKDDDKGKDDKPKNDDKGKDDDKNPGSGGNTGGGGGSGGKGKNK